MKRSEAFIRTQAIFELIQKESTGSPRQLASRIGSSERTIYRLIREVEELYSIKTEFSYYKNSYKILEK